MMLKTVNSSFQPVKAEVKKTKTEHVSWHYLYYSCSCVTYCKNTVCVCMMVWNDTWRSESEQAAGSDRRTACNPRFYRQAKKKSIQQYDVGSIRVLLVPFHIRKRPHLSVRLTAKWLCRRQTEFPWSRRCSWAPQGRSDGFLWTTWPTFFFVFMFLIEPLKNDDSCLEVN